LDERKRVRPERYRITLRHRDLSATGKGFRNRIKKNPSADRGVRWSGKRDLKIDNE